MSKKIFIVMFLIADITFASPMRMDFRKPRKIEFEAAKKEDASTLADDISEHLLSQGLDKEIAEKKIQKSLKGSSYLHDLMIHNILSRFDTIQHQEIVAYIAKNVLFERETDLGRHDHLIALMQSLHSVALDQESLEKIEKIGFENRELST